MKNAEQFLKKHRLTASEIDMQQVVDHFLQEMKAGLEGPSGSLLMIPTFIEAEGEAKTNEPVVAIDAGGTNFRTAKVFFDKNLNLITENVRQHKMPAVEKEMSKKEFFETFAHYLEEYKTVSRKIGFCFSYAAEIFPNKDGKLIEWSKEIKAPEVIGEMIGKQLLAAMGTPDKHLVLMNDTVSTLLAGKAAKAGKKYDTYIGFILGTGTNTSYIEENKKINKNPELPAGGSQIINIESGNFDKIYRTDIDITFDNSTKNPGRYPFEKMFSGGYFGGLCTTALKEAAREELFSPETREKLEKLPDQSTEVVNKFVTGTDLNENVLAEALVTGVDKSRAATIINGLIERAAKLVAANLAAVILKTGKATSPEKPALMTIEGTTFYKLYQFREMFEHFLQEFLSDKRKRYYEIVEVENSSLLGAAIAALINE